MSGLICRKLSKYCPQRLKVILGPRDLYRGFLPSISLYIFGSNIHESYCNYLMLFLWQGKNLCQFTSGFLSNTTNINKILFIFRLNVSQLHLLWGELVPFLSHLGNIKGTLVHHSKTLDQKFYFKDKITKSFKVEQVADSKSRPSGVITRQPLHLCP